MQHVAAVLRERLYGAISCLATLAVLARYTDANTSGWVRVLDVVVATGGLWLVCLFSDWVAHLGAHRQAPRGQELLRVLESSSQILRAAALPVLVLSAAGLGLLDTMLAVWIAMWVVVGELGIIALLAVRRTQLPWWQQLLSVALLVAAGSVVVAVKIIAH